MIDLQTLFTNLNTELNDTMSNLGFKIVLPDGISKGDLPVFTRDTSTYLQYLGEKGKVRILFNDDKIRLLAADKDAQSEDDSDYKLLASFLFVLDEYDLKDIKSTINEIIENLTDEFSPKKISARQQNIKAQATVSRSDVKNGSVFYDPATLAIRLAAMYPSIKEDYREHLALYDEFLCENFFTKSVNPYIYETIKENNPQKMKKLFTILNEIYEDGTNEVQDVIVVTVLSSFDYQGDMLTNVLGYVSDTMVESFVRVNSMLKKSKSLRMRLENPPAYKPPKKKKATRNPTLISQ